MTAQEPLVSVLTPVYNGEKYLAECIESVLGQTYRNWEYIIVNNRSTDRTREIIADYAAADSRIRLIDNSHFVSAIENHNIAFDGMSQASKYCKLVQADDWLFPECIEKMVRLAEVAPAAGVIGSYHLAGDKVRSDGVPSHISVIPGAELCRRTLLGEIYLFWRPTCLLLRSDIVRKRRPFYRAMHLNTDVDALYEVLQECDFGFVHQVLTFVRRHEGSQTRQDARKSDTQRLSRLGLLKKFGPVFLEAQELEARAAKLLDDYYRFLARSAFELKPRDFWRHQKSELESLGYAMQPFRVFSAMLSEIASRPRACIKRVRTGIRARAGQETG
jgi:glycosyltransferase involved in cell wall biosynthesis